MYLYKKILLTYLLLLGVSLLQAQTTEEIQNKNTDAIASISQCELNTPETESEPIIKTTTLLAKGIAEIQALNIKAYIFNRTLFVQLNNGNITSGELKIYSLSGIEMYSKLLHEPNHKIDLSAFIQGIYVLKIQNGNSIIGKKIMVD